VNTGKISAFTDIFDDYAGIFLDGPTSREALGLDPPMSSVAPPEELERSGRNQLWGGGVIASTLASKNVFSWLQSSSDFGSSKLSSLSIIPPEER
jgi:hypothetical protein